MKLVNLTGRPLRLYDINGQAVELPPDPRHVGIVAVGEHQRVENEQGHVFSMTVRSVKGLKLMPEPEADTLFVVSPEIALILEGSRKDVVVAREATIAGPGGRPVRITQLQRDVVDTAPA